MSLNRTNDSFHETRDLREKKFPITIFRECSWSLFSECVHILRAGRNDEILKPKKKNRICCHLFQLHVNRLICIWEIIPTHYACAAKHCHVLRIGEPKKPLHYTYLCVSHETHEEEKKTRTISYMENLQIQREERPTKKATHI